MKKKAAKLYLRKSSTQYICIQNKFKFQIQIQKNFIATQNNVFYVQ